MGADRFDSLTRSLTAAGSRRGALASALGGALATLGLAYPDDAAARKSGKCKPKCNECEKCDTGKCENKHGKKRCTKGKCKARAETTPCSIGSCRGGVCTAPPPPPAPDRNACTAQACSNPPSTCGPAGSTCICVNTGPAGAPAGPGRCIQPPSPGTIVACPSGGGCPTGQQCTQVCGNRSCLQPCV